MGHRLPKVTLWHRHLLTPFLLLVPFVFLFVHISSSPKMSLADKLGPPVAHTQQQAVAPAYPSTGVLRRHDEAVQAREYWHHLQVLQERRREAEQDKRQAARRRARLAALRRQQRAQARSVGATPPPDYSYTGPTTTQAEKAVAFAYAQLGCPYVWGGTGPCSSGYDCSGLVMAAWASAGVSIPRTSEAQWADLPHIPMSAIQPGDLLIFDGGGHVGMYVGGGMLIDSPQPGLTVEKIPLSTPWYQSLLVGAVRP